MGASREVTMPGVLDVASYILKLAKEDAQEGEYDITPMKLQKLIYYCQGFSLALLDAPLFPEPIEAWKHGPACPVLYNQLKHIGSLPVSIIKDNEPSLGQEERKIIKWVYGYYGQYSASKLRNMTHEESPWKSTDKNSVISIDSIRNYFVSCIDVNLKDMPPMTEQERNETIAILEEMDKNGELNLSSCL
jgi:uncharacterized phage-associated protein